MMDRRHVQPKISWADDVEDDREERFFSLRERSVEAWDGVVVAMDFDMSINGVTIALANALRKSIMSMVKNTAIDAASVVVEKNESNMHNEQLVHRLSMVPLHVSDPSTLVKTAFTIELASRNDHVSVSRLVTSKSLKFSWADPLVGETSLRDADGIVRPNPVTGKFMPLLVLEPGGHEVKLTCGVTTMSASEGGAAFQNHLCSYGVDNDRGMIEMHVEGYVCRDVADVVVEAMHALRASCQAMFDNARIKHHEEDDHMFVIDLMGHANVITCNLLQSFILQDSTRLLEETNLCFVGVHKPHPLQEGVRFVVAVRKGTTASCEDVRGIMTRYGSLLSMVLKDLVEEFTEFVRLSRLSRHKTQRKQ
jgi:hypothetical protein